MKALRKFQADKSERKQRESCRKEGETDMMMDYITLAGFVLSVFVAGVAVGKFKEKIERLIRDLENEEHRSIHKNDRR